METLTVFKVCGIDAGRLEHQVFLQEKIPKERTSQFSLQLCSERRALQKSDFNDEQSVTMPKIFAIRDRLQAVHDALSNDEEDLLPKQRPVVPEVHFQLTETSYFVKSEENESSLSSLTVTQTNLFVECKQIQQTPEQEQQCAITLDNYPSSLLPGEHNFLTERHGNPKFNFGPLNPFFHTQRKSNA